MKTVTALVAMFFCAAAAYSGAAPDPGAAYCSQLIPDLKFIHRQLIENSANVRYSTETAALAAAAYDAEMAAAPGCKGKIDYIRGVKRYIASYHDPHLTLNFDPAWLKGTGLAMKKLNGRYFVIAKIGGMASPGEVEAGDELVSCGGKPPLDILESEVLPFEAFYNKEAALYQYAKRGLFLRSDVTEGEETACLFRKGNKTFGAKLKWQQVDGHELLEYKNAYVRGPVYKFERIEGVPWITFSTFDPKNPEEAGLLSEFVEDVKKLRGEKIIVLDMRGNGGGNSDWGARWLKNLIGYSPVLPGRALIWASKANADYYESFMKKYFAEASLSPQEKEDWKGFVDCIKSRPDTFLECDSKLEHPDAKTERTGFKGRILLITDAGCFSSCEDFVLTLRLTGLMTQLGLATNASTAFGEIRVGVKTPSGFAKLNFPQKVFLIEGMGQGPLKPDIGIDYDVTEELKGIDSIKMAVLAKLRGGKL
ncbi:MAG: S41 family peptidase [Elusimicrobia bacterium]|nr:S41 family peptidase [Elusimicrobiota bacterium]